MPPKNKFWEIKNEASTDSAELLIYGSIGANEWWGDVGAKEFAKDLSNITANSLTVRINSVGGDVFAGLAIYNSLKQHKAKCTVRIDGLAASAASVVAMAGDEIIMPSGTMMMIHNAWLFAMGDAEELRQKADMLEKIDNSIVQVYADKTGLSADEILTIMSNDTWLTASEAVEKGFATSVDDTKVQASLDGSNLVFGGVSFELDQLPKKGLQISALAVNLVGAGGAGDGKKIQTQNKETQKMGDDEKVIDGGEAAKNPSASQQVDVNAKIEAERKRTLDITNLCMEHNLGADYMQEAIAKNYGVDAVMAKALEVKTAANKPHDVKISDLGSSPDAIKAMTDSISMKVGIKVENPHKDSNMFMRASMVDMAATIVGASRDVSAADVIKMALSTSDFPNILTNVGNKVIADSFETADTTYQIWTNARDIKDFKVNSSVKLGGFGNYQTKVELAKSPYASLTDGKEAYQLGTKGLKFALSREALINDDLSMFTDILPELGAAGYRTIENDAYGSLSTIKLADNIAFFHANHGNLAASGTAITVAALGAGRSAMRNQKDISGKVPLNITPKFLLVSPDKETEALSMMMSVTDSSQANANVPNIFKGSLQVVVSPYLSGNAWYLAAGRNTINIGYLAGSSRKPQIELMNRSLVNGLEYEAIFDYCVFAEDYRGMYKNPGN